MGIVNLTDDSYYAASRCAGVEAALRRMETMLEEGADIIDLGACSTRPGAFPVGQEEEWSRLAPVLGAAKERWPGLRLSIDTFWSSVVRKAFDLAGDFIVNDISAGEDDPDMLRTVGELGLTYVAMHKRGNPRTMQEMTDYQDVTAAVSDYFDKFALKAENAGIKDWILDPGFGFAKTAGQNYELMRNLSEFRRFGRPVLVGVSRKSMVYRTLDITPEESLPATQALHMKALCNGADVLRVHDVREARQTVSLFHFLR